LTASLVMTSSFELFDDEEAEDEGDFSLLEDEEDEEEEEPSFSPEEEDLSFEDDDEDDLSFSLFEEDDDEEEGSFAFSASFAACIFAIFSFSALSRSLASSSELGPLLPPLLLLLLLGEEVDGSTGLSSCETICNAKNSSSKNAKDLFTILSRYHLATPRLIATIIARYLVLQTF
jgi:hypothetical protein